METRATRSLNGCWTCRLRRKKCDESHPSCSRCISLKLMCHGYGSRPDWMDGGQLERAQAGRVKQIVKENTRQSRRNLHRKSLSQVPTLPGHLPTPPEAPTSSAPVESSSLGATNPVRTSVIRREYSPRNTSDTDPTGSDLVTTDSYHNDNAALQDHLSNGLEISIYSSNQPAARTSEESWLEPSMRSTGGVPESPFNELNSLHGNDPWVEMGLQTSIDNADRLVLSPSSVSSIEGSAVDYQTTLLPSLEEYSCERGISNTHSSLTLEHAPKYPNLTVCQGSWEGTLFMHYLDHVFYVQFPFYNLTPTNAGRGWLFQLLMRDKSVYHAALALSHYHRRSILENVDVADEHYIMALRGLQDTIGKSQTWSGTSGLINSVEALTCSLLLLFLEVFRGGTGAWQIHLRAAASLAPQIVKAYMLPSEDSPRSGTQCEWEDLRVLAPEDQTAITILIGSFIWFDILAAASTGLGHFLALDHNLLLQGSRIRLEELVGCENWVMAVIFQISKLGNWKKESESNHRLSISELAKRGAEIEVCLQERLTNILVQSAIQEDSFPEPTSRFSNSARVTMTKIYALAALTYLHVTISGPISELPEITESVTRTVAEFTSLSDARLLRYLVWPFCITGCLASEEQHSVFRTLIQTGDFNERTVGTCMEAFKVMEECWQRRTRLRNCDWISVMESLGHLILLG